MDLAIYLRTIEQMGGLVQRHEVGDQAMLYVVRSGVGEHEFYVLDGESRVTTSEPVMLCRNLGWQLTAFLEAATATAASGEQ